MTSSDPIINLAVETAAKIKGVSVERLRDMLVAHEQRRETKELIELIDAALRLVAGTAREECAALTVISGVTVKCGLRLGHPDGHSWDLRPGRSTASDAALLQLQNELEQVRLAHRHFKQSMLDALGIQEAWAITTMSEAAIADDIERGRELVTALLSEEECWTDHHGWCQAHNLQDLKDCPHYRARIWLARKKPLDDRDSPAGES